MTRKVRTLGKSRLYQEERRTQSTRLSLIRVANNMFSNDRTSLTRLRKMEYLEILVCLSQVGF